MKHILDVSEKYAALEIFDGLSDILKDSAKERPSGKYGNYRYVSFLCTPVSYGRTVIIFYLFPSVETSCSCKNKYR
jgi:hypothetical protein